MKCADCLESLGPFIDGELPPDEVALVEEHLKTCADCAAAHQRLVATSSQLKKTLMRYEAPDVLKARIRASITEAARDAPDQPVMVPLPRRSAWQRTFAAAAVVAIVSSGLTYAVVNQRASANPVEQEVLASHIRSLMPGHLTDVASNDQHNVKPWFNGRANVSPDVPRLDSLGFPLIGGRLDYIDGHNAAVVVYTRRQHVINVFSWASPGPTEQSGVLSTSNGYHLIRARHNGLEIWIVSDLNESELRDFARMVIPPR